MISFAHYDSLHGLVRGENMELGRDSDTGGQVVFFLQHLSSNTGSYSYIFNYVILLCCW